MNDIPENVPHLRVVNSRIKCLNHTRFPGISVSAINSSIDNLSGYLYYSTWYNTTIDTIRDLNLQHNFYLYSCNISTISRNGIVSHSFVMWSDVVVDQINYNGLIPHGFVLFDDVFFKKIASGCIRIQHSLVETSNVRFISNGGEIRFLMDVKRGDGVSYRDNPTLLLLEPNYDEGTYRNLLEGASESNVVQNWKEEIGYPVLHTFVPIAGTVGLITVITVCM